MVSGAGGSGGDAGGGETPARRCHLLSSQPCQAGWQWCQNIFTRLTDCITNIVPQWLPHYFSKNEAVSEQEPPGLENREDDPLICADEESANTHDGRISPEPRVSNTEDTSRTTTSNCPHVVTRPSLHLSHGNFSMSESFALNSETFTSSFPKGSSQVSLVKEMKDFASQHDNAASENTSVPHLWSVETKRHSFSRHTATSLKNPAILRRLSQSIGKSSILQTSQHGISRFYAVETRFGGSIAFPREPKVRNTLYQAPVAIKMKPKGLNAQSYGVTSLTARRILSQYLEKKSSPVADTERIPHVAVAPLNSVDSHYPPIQRLMNTKPVFIHQLIYFKPSLTPCGELKKANQRKDKNLSTGYETAMTPGQTTEQDSMSAANGSCSGAGHERGKMTGERKGYLATKPLEKEAPLRNKAHQLNAQSYDETRSKVQRILRCLEMWTSPLLDAKRIPFDISSPRKSPRYRSGIDTTRKLGAKRRKVDCDHRPVQRLMIPKPLAIAANPIIYFKSYMDPSCKLKKTDQRIDKKLNVQVTSSNNTGHFISSISTPIVQTSQADIGFTVTGTVAKTAELSGSSSNFRTNYK